MVPLLPPPAPRPDYMIPQVCSDLSQDGSYANIGARNLPNGRLDFVEFRGDLEAMAGFAFTECWYFDHEQKGYPDVRALKQAAPLGPQFQVKLYQTKLYQCRCPKCNNPFKQKIQKGVDNGIATKMLSLVYEQVADRLVLVAGDGDFYDSLDLIKNTRHKELWVVGYRPSVSPDLQQLATKIVWIEDMYPGDVPAAPLVDDEADVDRAMVRTPPPVDTVAESNHAAALIKSDPLSVFVGNIPFDAVEAEVSMYFDSYGVVKSVRMVVDRGTGTFRGFAFVHFDSMDAVDAAIASSGEPMRGRKLTIRRLREHQGPPPPAKSAVAPALVGATSGPSVSPPQWAIPVPSPTEKKAPPAAATPTDTTRARMDAVSKAAKRALKRKMAKITKEWSTKRPKTESSSTPASKGDTVDLSFDPRVSAASTVDLTPYPARKSQGTAGAAVIDLCWSDDDI